jgi:protein arginine kinase activator
MSAPFRPCDRCDKPAVVHNTTIEGGVLNEVHLCEEHAAEANIPATGAASLGAMVAQLTVKIPAGSKGPACPRCGMKWAEYRQHGVLGCGECYAAFATTLNMVLERAHGGAAQHVGKTPARVDAARQRAAVLQRMLQELEEAVRAEQYERAAALRDEIKALRPGTPGTSGSPGAPGAHGAPGIPGTPGTPDAPRESAATPRPAGPTGAPRPGRNGPGSGPGSGPEGRPRTPPTGDRP